MSMTQAIQLSELSQHFQFVNQGDSDRLFDKQMHARRALNKNPFARTLNCRWRIEYRNRLQRKMESKVLKIHP